MVIIKEAKTTFFIIVINYKKTTVKCTSTVKRCYSLAGTRTSLHRQINFYDMQEILL